MAKQESNGTPFPDHLIEEAVSVVQRAGGDQLASVEALRLAVEELVVRAALEGNGWSLNAAARAMGKPAASALERVIERHPALAREWRARGPRPIGE